MLELVFNQVLGLKVYFEKHLRTAASIKILQNSQENVHDGVSQLFHYGYILDDFKNKQQKCMK